MIIVVTGLPRSGTTLMMRMLEAGGIEPYFDGDGDSATITLNGIEHINFNMVLRETSNIKNLKKPDWLNDCHGMAIKNLDPIKNVLPPDHEYRFIYMDRKLKAMTKSQIKFKRYIRGLKTMPEKKLIVLNRQARKDSINLLKTYPMSDMTKINFEDVLKSPKAISFRVSRFLEKRLDIDKMAGCVIKRSPSNYKGFLEEIYI